MASDTIQSGGERRLRTPFASANALCLSRPYTIGSVPTIISNAREWLVENPSESINAACRIFKVPESTLRLSIKRRIKNPQQRKGGQNKVLSTAQTEALNKWILGQYYLGLGANTTLRI